MDLELKAVKDVERDSSQMDVEEKQLHVCDTCKKIDNANPSLAERYCIKCEVKLCPSCSQQHEKKEDHLVVVLNERKETKKFKASDLCIVHDEELAELYCSFCRKVICGKCENESHSSHNCSKVSDVADLVAKQAETVYENLRDNMQCHFDKEIDKLSNEEIKIKKTVEDMETDIRKRCDEIKEFVDNERNALLKELEVIKTERLEEIKMERRKMEGHAFAFEKFKEYCDRIKSNAVPRYTCEAEDFLRNIPDDLKSRPEGRWKSKLFSVQLSIQKKDFKEIVTSLREAVGKLTIRCAYKMTRSRVVELDDESVYGMARLHDKLYLLSDSRIFIRRLQSPCASVGEIKTPDIESPKEIVSCSKTSCLYVYDNGADCVWKVSIPDHRVRRWLNNVKEPDALSVTPNAEVLVLRNSKPICLELYNENAILVRLLKFPASIPSLSCIYETASGKYFGLGKLCIFALNANGSIISQFEPSKHSECWGNPRCFVVSPCHIFLHCFPIGMRYIRDDAVTCCTKSDCGPISSLTFDLESHQSMKTKISGLRTPVTSCYLEETKQLLVLEGAIACARLLRIYNVFPA